MNTIHRAAISWSAGKDSCLALLMARESGLDVTTYLTMQDPDGLSKSHALPSGLIEAQVRALGGRWLPVATSSADYAVVFAAALDGLRADSHTHLVFGDIDLQAHRDWLEPMCRRAGLVPVFPLWLMDRSAVARAIVRRGIRARVVAVDTRWLDASHCGIDYDDAFLARLPADVCPCGEGGEFHTFVWDAPGFDRALQLGRGVQRRVHSSPPLAPAELVFEAPLLLEDAVPRSNVRPP